MLSIQNLHKAFGQQTVANSIDLDIGNGEIVALLGASGCGKSTLLKMVAGLEAPDCGQIFFDEKNITHLKPEQRHFALMFQDFALFPHLNVLENVAFGLRRQGMSKADSHRLAEEMLLSVGLESKSLVKTWQLSGGEQQRVALARALVIQPKALLLDEPFSSLDTHLKAQLQALVFGSSQARSLPTLLVTHDKTEALLYADKIAIMQEGRIVQLGQGDELINHPINFAVAKLMGCDNVFADEYIPQLALSLDWDRGDEVPIVKVDILPEGVCLTLKWRDKTLRWRLSIQDWHQLQSYTAKSNVIKIMVNQSLCVPFVA